MLYRNMVEYWIGKYIYITTHSKICRMQRLHYSTISSPFWDGGNAYYVLHDLFISKFQNE